MNDDDDDAFRIKNNQEKINVSDQILNRNSALQQHSTISYFMLLSSNYFLI